MEYSVSIYVEGDREIQLEEVVQLADAVAAHKGVASGAGAYGYGAQVVVIAESELEARERAIEVFDEAVRTAKMPEWPIVNVETISEREAFELEDQ